MSNALDRYEKIRTVGKGAFGVAVLYRKKSNNEMVVIKEINTSDLSSEERQMALNEVEVLSSLNHPNIIGYAGSFIVQDVLMIEMEYADGGTLSEMLSNKTEHIPEREVLDLISQISSAIAHMHENNILHRDLKTVNIFMNLNGCVKIGDFGIAKVLTTSVQAQTVLGTPYYISPEMCEGKEYNEKSDIWAMGCILYEICCLQKTFQASSLSALVNKIMMGKYKPLPGGYSVKLNKLVRDLLNKDPDKRPTAREVHDTYIPDILLSLGNKGYEYINLFQSEHVDRTVLYELKTSENDIELNPIQLPPRIKIVNVSTGSNHFIAVTEDGSVFVWGDGKKGQLGLGETVVQSLQPQMLSAILDKNVTMSAAGDEFSLLLLKDGTILSFGNGTYGTLGHGDWSNCNEPKLIVTLIGVHIIFFSCSDNHVGAITDDNMLYTWGCGRKGQTGQYSLHNSCLPMLIDIKNKLTVNVKCSFESTIIITSDKTILACGWNNHNKLSLVKRSMFKRGDDYHEFVAVFSKMKGIPEKVINYSIGESHCAFLVKNNNNKNMVYMTGSFSGLSNSKSIHYPTRITSLDDIDVKSIVCGPSYIVLGTEDNCIMLWGITYKIHETRSYFDDSESKINPKYSNSFSSLKREKNVVKHTYVPEVISTPETLLALYASPYQLSNNTSLLLDSLYPLKYSILFLIKTNVPLKKISNSSSLDSIAMPPTEDFDTIGPLPLWMKEEIALSKYSWTDQFHKKT